jgi:hypothetical protein
MSLTDTLPRLLGHRRHFSASQGYRMRGAAFGSPRGKHTSAFGESQLCHRRSAPPLVFGHDAPTIDSMRGIDAIRDGCTVDALGTHCVDVRLFALQHA